MLINSTWTDNWDYRRYGAVDAQPLKHRLARRLKELPPVSWYFEQRGRDRMLDEGSGLEWLIRHLEGDQSRHLLVALMAYRVLGHRKVKLPQNTPDFWRLLEELELHADRERHLDPKFLDWELSPIDLQPYGWDLDIYSNAKVAYALLILEQYRCVREGLPPIEVESGDTVIDGGGCWGDTALCFATKTGPSGRVFSMEFMPENLTVFRENLAANLVLAGHVEIIEYPLWSTSDEAMAVEGAGPSARLVAGGSVEGHLLTTLSIDDLASRRGI